MSDSLPHFSTFPATCFCHLLNNPPSLPLSSLLSPFKFSPTFPPVLLNCVASPTKVFFFPPRAPLRFIRGQRGSSSTLHYAPISSLQSPNTHFLLPDGEWHEVKEREKWGGKLRKRQRQRKGHVFFPLSPSYKTPVMNLKIWQSTSACMCSYVGRTTVKLICHLNTFPSMKSLQERRDNNTGLHTVAGVTLPVKASRSSYHQHSFLE